MSASVFLIGASVLTVAGGVLCYLASRNQLLLARAPNARLCLLVGGALICVALGVLLQARSPATAVFMLLTLLMAVWSLLPLGLALLRYRKKGP
ncbi:MULTISPECIES: hypothetical protein [Acetobacter]|uniref:Uncharacterized protein n=2 Tax=Acetobacter TaxID=434 RepID=A0A0U5EX90_9PROT|nr:MULTISPECIES: hypothetical protein [Acetobacter]ATJ90611.1 hypothetical protein CIW82_07860 [Acetobacter tropicalis]CEF40248.1 hypothetical protein predicted by Glimmer/Critica [Acetobacter senegalensis]